MRWREHIEPGLIELLTDREREVLDLLRLGLTNAQIAQRLDISLDGAKYHVAEISGKLGVRNRREAAYWPERPPWWASVVLPLAGLRRGTRVPSALSRLGLGLAVGLVVVVLAGLGLIAFLLMRSNGDEASLASATCPSRPPLTFGNNSNLTPEEVARRGAQAVSCPGYAFHMLSAGDVDAGPLSSYSEGESWVDSAHNRSRQEGRSQFTSEEARRELAEGEELPELHSVSIALPDATYTRSDSSSPDADPRRVDKRAPSPCFGFYISEGASVADCDGPLDEFEYRVEANATYRDRQAVAIVSTGTSRGSDETYALTNHYFVDAVTFLPLGATSEGTLNDAVPVNSSLPIEWDFVPLDSLPDDFFDPAGIGYVEPSLDELTESLDRFGGRAYWLGREFTPSGGLPALVLEDGYGNHVLYRRADEDSHWAVVSFQLFPANSWRNSLTPPSERCAEQREIALPDRGATIFQMRDGVSAGAECPPNGTFTAIVFIRDAAIYVEAPGISTGTEHLESPYNSEAGMELLLRSLKLME